MSLTERLMPASPERVFAVLSDPSSYGEWVVGSDTGRDADATWPAVGSRFHHRVGVGLLKINDHTEVLAVEPGRRLELQAKDRPLGTARIDLCLERRGGGRLVALTGGPAHPLSKLVFNPLPEPLAHLRNKEALRRRERLALAG